MFEGKIRTLILISLFFGAIAGVLLFSVFAIPQYSENVQPSLFNISPRKIFENTS